jgi:transposase InsO family protein
MAAPALHATTRTTNTLIRSVRTLGERAACELKQRWGALQHLVEADSVIDAPNAMQLIDRCVRASTFVLDAFSRRIVGWWAATHMRTDLPLDALVMALWRQKIKKDVDLIHHSVRGSQGVSIRYMESLAEVGAFASVGSVAHSTTVSLLVPEPAWIG